MTKEQVEIISEYLLIFQKAYILTTGKKLETVEQILELIKSGKFTFEDDVWGIYLDATLQELSNSESEYFDNHIEDFFCEVYFPEDNKRLPDGGAWVKIRTETGFEVHFAKKSLRKKRWNELIAAELKSSKRNMNLSKLDKAQISLDAITELRIREAIKLAPYEIYINRTKAKKEYYFTNQYTIVDDIERFSEAYMASITGVYSKNLYTSVNKDAIFYLQSRGIPKKVAEIMASLKQMYFIVNIEEAMGEYNRQWRNVSSSTLSLFKV